MIDAMCRSIAWSSATSADEFLSADCAAALADAAFTVPGRHGEWSSRRLVNSVAARKRKECRFRSLLPADEQKRPGDPVPTLPPRFPARDIRPPGVSGTGPEPPSESKPIPGH